VTCGNSHGRDAGIADWRLLTAVDAVRFRAASGAVLASFLMGAGFLKEAVAVKRGACAIT